MRHASLLAFTLTLICHRADAQQPDSATFRRARAPVPPSAARRDADRRRRRVDFIPATTLDANAERLRSTRTTGMPLHTSDDQQTTYLLLRRTVSSKPEVHARWDDIVFIRSGTGAIEMGDSLVGSTLRAPGEKSGGKFTKSYQVIVRAGDVVRIPAAVPHAFIVSGSEALEYLVIKLRRQELPIRWFEASRGR